MDLSVLTVARTLPHDIRGGMEEVAWSLARALAAQRAKVTILTTAMDHRARIWDDDGVSVHALSYVPRRLRGRPPYRWWSHFGAAAARYAKRAGFAPDIVHSHSVYVDGFLRVRPRPPIVVTLYGTPMDDYLAGSRDRLIREVGPHHPRVILQRAAVRWATWKMSQALRRTDAVVAISPLVAGKAPGVAVTDPRLSVIPIGIDPEKFPWLERAEARQMLGLPASAPILAFLGRVEEDKGVGRLVGVLDQVPDVHLVIAGDGSYLETLRRRALESPVRDRVHFLGRIPDERRPSVLASADLVCLPSRVEGGAPPLALLEALGMGTSVATTGPWIPDSLMPYSVVDSDVVRMVQAGLLRSRTVDRRRARDAVMNEFTWDRIARRYMALFERLRARTS